MWNKIPHEIWWEIMLFLKLKDLKSIIFVSKEFYQVQQNDNFWKEKFKYRFKNGYPNCLETKKTWKKKYFNFKSYLNEYIKIGENLTNLEMYLSIYCSWNFIIEVVKYKGMVLQFASKEPRNDKEVVLAAVKNDGRALEFASEELRNDKEVVLAAVKQNEWVLQFASKELRNDKEVVLVAVKDNGF